MTASASPALTTIYGLDDYILMGDSLAVHADDLKDGRIRRFSVEFVITPVGELAVTEEVFWAANLEERMRIKRAAALRFNHKKKKRGGTKMEPADLREALKAESDRALKEHSDVLGNLLKVAAIGLIGFLILVGLVAALGFAWTGIILAMAVVFGQLVLRPVITLVKWVHLNVRNNSP